MRVKYLAIVFFSLLLLIPSAHALTGAEIRYRAYELGICAHLFLFTPGECYYTYHGGIVDCGCCIVETAFPSTGTGIVCSVGGTSPGPSCEQVYTKDKCTSEYRTHFADGSSCVLFKDGTLFFPPAYLKPPGVDAKWDQSEGKCITCTGLKTESMIYGDGKGVYSGGVSGDLECESACGAPPDLDEKSPFRSYLQLLSYPSKVLKGDKFSLTYKVSGVDPNVVSIQRIEHHGPESGGDYCIEMPGYTCEWKTQTFELQAPSTPGTYTYYVKAKATASGMSCDEIVDWDSEVSFTVKVVECFADEDCITLGKTCEDQGYPHRYAKCAADNTCTWCTDCRSNQHCEPGYCCESTYAGGPGGGQCRAKGPHPINPAYLCDPPSWTTQEISRQVSEQKNLLEIILNFFTSLFRLS